MVSAGDGRIGFYGTCLYVGYHTQSINVYFPFCRGWNEFVLHLYRVIEMRSQCTETDSAKNRAGFIGMLSDECLLNYSCKAFVFCTDKHWLWIRHLSNGVYFGNIPKSFNRENEKASSINMIRSKQELKFYIMADRMMNRGYFNEPLPRKIASFLYPDWVMKYLKALRKAEYYSNSGGTEILLQIQAS